MSLNDCIEYPGYKDRDGYCQVRRDGHRYGAHRWYYIVTYGPVPKEMVVRHKCDNPPCCNPLHLELGTHADNMADKMRRNRWSNGRATWTHCVNGHEFSEENTRMVTNRKTGKESRVCRTCKIAANRRYRKRVKDVV